MHSRLFLSALFAVSLAACVPPPPNDDAIIDYEEDTVMGLIQDAGVLRVAFENRPPFAFVEDGGEPDGFAAEFARDVGASLGVEKEFLEVSAGEDPIALVDQDEADLALPMVPITERAVRASAFTDPYFVAHQRILVKEDVPVEGVDDLSGMRVCSFVYPDTEVSLDELNPNIDIEQTGDFDECLHSVRDPRIDAVTAADVFLMSIVFQDGSFTFTGDELATEGFGAVVEDGAASWRDYVNNVLWEAKDEGRWSHWYEEWIAPYVDEPDTEPPKMTLEEAAALFPVSQEDV
jgi:ABC-type amino acid transport substrate-binding protein